MKEIKEICDMSNEELGRLMWEIGLHIIIPNYFCRHHLEGMLEREIDDEEWYEFLKYVGTTDWHEEIAEGLLEVYDNFKADQESKG